MENYKDLEKMGKIRDYVAYHIRVQHVFAPTHATCSVDTCLMLPARVLALNQLGDSWIQEPGV